MTAFRALRALGLFAATVAAACGGDGPPAVSTTEVGAILIDAGSFQIERGSHRTLTATVKDIHGQGITVPLVWRSSDEKVATFEPGGRMTAVDTGVTVVEASSLGVTSSPITVHVVWQGPAKIAEYEYTSPSAASPGGYVDSIRVRVRNPVDNPVANARVAFAVTAGDGTVSQSIDTTNALGIAAVRWTLGPKLGVNSMTATVIGDDDKPLTYVASNPVKFSIDSYQALSAVAGDAQTALILDSLPVAPAVKLVDSAGKPRVGVPITFEPTLNGRVTVPIVSTGADGVASPGVWTLGDRPGDQQLIVRVESATLSLHATATGTPIHYKPKLIVAGGFSTCGLDDGSLASCMGQEPQLGDGDTAQKATPTPTAGALQFNTLVSSLSGTVQNHFCGVSSDNAIYCWGGNALTDTTGKGAGLALTPARLESALPWTQVAAGGAHNCGLTTDQLAYCWGANNHGQLGIRADTSTQFVPTAVYGNFKFLTLTAGANHTCGITVDRTTLCWGLNAFGQLGDGTQLNRLAPTLVLGGVTFQSVGAGESFSCGLSTAGKAYCWGAVEGVGVSTTPHGFDNVPVFTALSVGTFHACALTGTGFAWCWGNNQFGQLGDSTVTARATPTPVAGGLQFKSISAGVAHTCGITLDGSVACWGLNVAGEQGDKKSALRTTPHFVVLGVTP
jgi:alpha-tubulin suppressor-like RCC1 family protein